MKNEFLKSKVDVWGGIECSFNRVANTYMDQLELSGHYHRKNDIERFAELGIKAIRYPVLWEKHQPNKETAIDWTYTSQKLYEIQQQNIVPIIGLVHHGSGPVFANFYDGSFATGLAAYAKQVAARFPWVENYTPVNEPLTTARFCGLYGHWYPHGKTDFEFLQILLAECKGTVLAMQEIRRINPRAKLVQTEDLGKSHSTRSLQYQANFENERRWLSFDLLCGKVNADHPLWQYMINAGIPGDALSFFLDNPTSPDIIGINHYVTSERFLDDRISYYPAHTIGGNHHIAYADVEAVRVAKNDGPMVLLQEAWDRFKLPIAVTEVHLHCTREEQLRWFMEVWHAANVLKNKGVDIKAITAWAMLGSFDWNSLLTQPKGEYEAGLYDVRSLKPRATALTRLVQSLAHGRQFTHPVLEVEGWWKRPCRVLYETGDLINDCNIMTVTSSQPLIIIGKSGTLARAFKRICVTRGIHHLSFGRDDINITDATDFEKMIIEHKPWCIVNTAGYVKVDDAEFEREACFNINSVAPAIMSQLCEKYAIQFATFSSDLVFDGKKLHPYVESDLVSPLNIYGQSKAEAEEKVVLHNPSALIVRTSAFFGPWDKYNFVYHTLDALKNQEDFTAAHDVIISPTYVPDLVNTTLDLLLDEASGIWNISNKGSVSWAMLAHEVAERSGLNTKKVTPISISDMKLAAPRPGYSVLNTEKGFELPSLDNALERYFKEQELITV